MTATAVSLREAARHCDGRFGEHRRGELDVDLAVEAQPTDPLAWEDTPLSKIPLDARVTVEVLFPHEKIEGYLIGNGGARGSRLLVDDEGRFFEVKGARRGGKYIRMVTASEEQFALRRKCLELATNAGLVAGLTFIGSGANLTLHRTGCDKSAPSAGYHQKLDSFKAVRQAIDSGVLDQLVSQCPCMAGR